MTTVAVLIGGPCDGRRVAVHDGVRDLMAIGPPRTAAMGVSAAGQSAKYSDHIRYREFWGAPGLSCMCPEGMTQVAAMRALIEGYRHEIQGS